MGPTGVGKSDLAVAAALRLGGEIVNADSMQVFRHLPIGTAGPTPHQLAAVPHHLFAFLEPDQDPDAGAYARLAADAIADIAARGRVPIVAGGTFFWMRALFDGLSDMPEVAPEARERVAATLLRDGVETLHARLAAVDPATAARLQPRDTQRVARALEVFEATGTPLSAFQARPPRPAVEADVLRVALVRPREDLYRRIEARVDRMLEDGLVAEVRAVLARGFPPDVRPLRASSLKPVVDHVLGRIDLESARALVAQGHRNYAKRQLTWLRSEPSARTMNTADPDAVLELLADFLG
jgi:tRNA dimethylallyltransferase